LLDLTHMRGGSRPRGLGIAGDERTMDSRMLPPGALERALLLVAAPDPGAKRA
jgi:hypothetical protein